MDVASFLGNAIKIDGLWYVAGLTGSVFHRKKKSTLVATMCLHTIQLVIYVGEGRNGWMAADSAGYHLQLN